MSHVPYFDGDTPDTVDWTYSWTGTPHASPSTRSATPGLWVEPYVDAPVPRVGITVTGLDPVGPSVVTVWRSSAGGKRRKVRGWSSRVVYGSDFTLDYEAPLGRLVTYDMQVITGAVVPLRLSDSTTLDVDHGYIQDPLLPLGAVAVSGDRDERYFTGTAFQELEYAVESSQVAILGSDEPVALTGQRLAASGVSFDMITKAAQEATDLRNLLSTTPLVLVRPLPKFGPLPDLIYTVPSVIEQPVDVSWGGSFTRWNLTGNTVAPPSIQVLVALWTYDQVQALRDGMTYDQVQAVSDAAASTYLADQRDPTMGV